MFKKAVEAKSHQRLSGADRKKLKRTIRDRFARASDADIDALIPPKAEIKVSKLQNRVVVYSVEGGLPMFFDVDGRGTEIFPTVYALWLVPELLPAFTVKAGEVSRFIVGGADLMFPGVSVPVEGLPTFSSGEPWAIKVPGNSAPIAVGNTTMSSAEALQAGLRGKALKITHYYPDLLWESADGRYVPNAGFFEDVVLEDPAMTPTQCTNLMDEDKDASVDEQVGIRGGEGEQALDSNIEIEHTSKVIEENVIDAESIMEAVDGLKVSEAGSSEEHVEQNIISTDDVDSLLDRCLLQALHTTVKDKDLPLPGSTLW